ncbi:hypothetical protein A0J61_02163 [Choanephora cucurbitarum]|uniref:Uncharacterized protein n=1 Tax=Choanephora cucurbitarum TaxID=101091 RepID=A0A1C7NKX9_9FUNG|nr:hypothetical protein A0J61_02163 [Choanephora cucurbitarum]
MKPFILFCLFLIVTAVFAQQQKEEVANQNLANTDDSSLFRGVENAIDESTEEDDAYRILKSLQDVTDEGEEDSDMDDDNDEADSDLSEQDLIDMIHEADNDDNDDNDDEDDDEDEDDEDFVSSFPEFQNEETTEFFKNLPQQSTNKGHMQDEIEQKIENVDQEEEDDQANEPVEEAEEDEVEEQIKQEEENIEMDHAAAPFEGSQQFIPWKRPDHIIKTDNTDFYQDINFRESPETTVKSSRFKLWHFLCIIVILMIVYYRQARKTTNNMVELSNAGPSLSWPNEKDFLPSHSYNNNNKHFKFG